MTDTLTLDAMTPAEVNTLATQVVRDRLVGFAATGGTAMAGSADHAVLPPTEAELRWEACGPHRPVTATLLVSQCIPL